MSFRAIASKRILVTQRCLCRQSSSFTGSKNSLEKIQTDLKSQLDQYINKLHKASDKFKQLTSEVNNSKEALQKASRVLNELTGYNHIETVKEKVTRQAALLNQLVMSTQRSINELLQRKHLWTADDVTKFTELYRLEHAHTQAEMTAKERYQTCEKQMDREYMELARSIMERYHEEQLWSDKIRSASTYGTWALMGVNLLLFVAVQTVFEPRKRKRLTDRFEELLVAKVNEEEEKFKHVFESLDEKDRLLVQQQIALMEAVNTLTEHPLFDQATLDALKQTNNTTDNPIESSETNKATPHQTPLLDDDNLIKAILLPIENQVEDKDHSYLWQSVQSAIAGGLVTAIAIYFLNQ
ncbi:unnamed protein product [Rhizopus microsporus]